MKNKHLSRLFLGLKIGQSHLSLNSFPASSAPAGSMSSSVSSGISSVFSFCYMPVLETSSQLLLQKHLKSYFMELFTSQEVQKLRSWQHAKLTHCTDCLD